MAILELINQASLEVGLNNFTQFSNNNDLTAQQFIALANRAGNSIVSEFNWQCLHKEHRFTTVAYPLSVNVLSGSNVITSINTSGLTSDFVLYSITGFSSKVLNIVSMTSNQVAVDLPCNVTQSGFSIIAMRQSYDMPSDFASFIDNTFINNQYSYIGMNMVTPQEKQYLRYFLNSNAYPLNYYIKQNKITLVDMPIVNGQLIAFDYLSNGFVNSNGVASNKIITDNDVLVIDENLFILGLKYRFLQKNGLDYTQQLAEYNQQLAIVKSRDKPAFNLNAGICNYNIPIPYIPNT